MKLVLTLFTFLFSLNFIHAQVFDVETIKASGDNDKRLNLVILSEGYQTSEFAKFKTDAESLVSDMFTQSPFLEYSEYFNVHIIKVPSNESGADHPATAITDPDEPGGTPVFVDTYFNATFDAFGYHRYLYYGIDYADAAAAGLKINSVLADNFPTYDQALILVNTYEYGGTGGEFPISSTGNNANNIAIHELGHSLFDLKDEYLLRDVSYAEAINMTQDTNPSTVKWKNWINTNGINIYQHGTSGVPSNWYKPQSGNMCKMEKLTQPFCSVCKEGMVKKIHTLISPIEDYTPNNNSISNPTLPLNFQLILIKPIPNTLESEWTLNANNFANNVDNISLLETNLVEGTNTLTAIVNDDTSLVRTDNYENINIHTITWTINYSTLGIEKVESDVINYDISLYPNPANTILNLKFESNTATNLKVELISLDGKKVKTKRLSSFENHQLDISNLTSGVYISNFYANNVLIASKKVIKN